MTEHLITWDDFMRVGLHVGTIIDAQNFDGARKPAYILTIDLGADIGIKKSSAQITLHYEPEELIGKQVLCVVNFPKKQIGKIMSEVLTTGADDEDGKTVLLCPDKPLPNGARLL